MRHPTLQGATVWLRATLLLAAWPGPLLAQPTSAPNAARTNGVLLIDLPAALQLAGARSLDIQIARAKLLEARANRESSIWQFFPSVTPGLGYRRHDNLIQDVQGRILEVHKDSYTAGPVIGGQLDLGEAIYRSLASRQLVKASELGLETRRQEATLAAALGYFELARAQAAVSVAQEAVRIVQDYAGQVQRAVDAGVAFKGDALRAQLQVEKNQLALRQTQEQQRVAAARLVQTLHLEPGLDLAVPPADPLPIELIATNAALDSLIGQALAARPELAQSRFLLEAARDAKNGAKFGPLIPSLGAQVFVGGLGGGNDATHRGLGESEDYTFTLGWRVGPGGLFDRGRVRSAEARWRLADLSSQKLTDEVIRQVTESFARWRSLTDQMSTSRRAVQAAAETLRLTQERKQFAVGVVLENIHSEQELTRARLDYLNTIAEYNKAQYALRQAVGGLPASGGPEPVTPAAEPRKGQVRE